VIGEVDALIGTRRAADPARIRADQQARQPHDRGEELQRASGSEAPWLALLFGRNGRGLLQGVKARLPIDSGGECEAAQRRAAYRSVSERFAEAGPRTTVQLRKVGKSENGVDV
jgi:hypothetical protein